MKVVARGTRGARGAQRRSPVGAARARGLAGNSTWPRTMIVSIEAWAAETRGGRKCPPSMLEGLRAVYKEDAF
eukprot:3741215-Prymnesium_polylepis.3